MGSNTLFTAQNNLFLLISLTKGHCNYSALLYFSPFFARLEKAIIKTTASKMPTGISRVASPTDKPITIAAT
jgi:hypothetical protein